MTRRFIHVLLSIALLATLLFPVGMEAQATSIDFNRDSIVKHNSKTSSLKLGMRFTWGYPEPISPVLYPSSPQAATMVEEPLAQIDDVMESFIESGTFP